MNKRTGIFILLFILNKEEKMPEKKEERKEEVKAQEEPRRSGNGFGGVAPPLKTGILPLFTTIGWGSSK